MCLSSLPSCIPNLCPRDDTLGLLPCRALAAPAVLVMAASQGACLGQQDSWTPFSVLLAAGALNTGAGRALGEPWPGGRPSCLSGFCAASSVSVKQTLHPNKQTAEVLVGQHARLAAVAPASPSPPASPEPLPGYPVGHRAHHCGPSASHPQPPTPTPTSTPTPTPPKPVGDVYLISSRGMGVAGAAIATAAAQVGCRSCSRGLRAVPTAPAAPPSRLPRGCVALISQEGLCGLHAARFACVCKLPLHSQKAQYGWHRHSLTAVPRGGLLFVAPVAQGAARQRHLPALDGEGAGLDCVTQPATERGASRRRSRGRAGRKPALRAGCALVWQLARWWGCPVQAGFGACCCAAFPVALAGATGPAGVLAGHGSPCRQHPFATNWVPRRRERRQSELPWPRPTPPRPRPAGPPQVRPDARVPAGGCHAVHAHRLWHGRVLQVTK